MASPPEAAALAASFSACLALSLACCFSVVERMAVTTRSFLTSFFALSMGGYAKWAGEVAHLTLKAAGSFRSSLRPTNIDGVKDSEKKWCMGYQYQCWHQSVRPMQAEALTKPAWVWSCTAQLRPPASSTPAARIAPSFVRVEGYLSLTMAAIFSRKPLTEGAANSDCCISTIAVASSAPCRTKSTWSDSIGCTKDRAVSSPLPAHAMPTAKHAP
mmetsp:Transcript_5095/g.16027  ORF Transcript_5095/g.16027 Transcript_5095/m.16027 type:complete len:215 (-) Transcript_5095:2251-2895(-)